jgi:hypothetical protein
LHFPRATGILPVHFPRATGILPVHFPRATGILPVFSITAQAANVGCRLGNLDTAPRPVELRSQAASVTEQQKE